MQERVEGRTQAANFTEKQVLEAVRNLRGKRAPGLDGIAAKAVNIRAKCKPRGSCGNHKRAIEENLSDQIEEGKSGTARKSEGRDRSGKVL